MYNALVVDDEPLVREFLKETIPSLNNHFTVTADAMDGHEALEIIMSHHIDLVITDIKMPEMDGLDLCKRIRERYPDMQIIIISGYDDFTYAKKAIHYRVSEYLLKPIVNEELKMVLDKIHNHLENEKALEKIPLKENKNEIIRNYLKALVTGAKLEIRKLESQVAEMDPLFVNKHGYILLLAIDEETVPQKKLFFEQLSAFRYSLYQTVCRELDDNPYIHVFYDDEENTALLFLQETGQKPTEDCFKVYSQIASGMLHDTGLNITGATGDISENMACLKQSYDQARNMLLRKIKYGGGRLYLYRSNTGHDDMDDIKKQISLLKSSILENNKASCNIIIDSYIKCMEDLTYGTVCRYALYLIKSLSSIDKSLGEALVIDKSFQFLREFSLDDANNVFNLFQSIVSVFLEKKHGKENESGENEIVRKAKEYIFRHYSEQISLDMIAEELKVSTSYLSDIFHKEEGQSYIKFITTIRMKEAARLLRLEPYEKISSISQKVGYLSPKHFNHVFKKHFNMTPGEYKENNSKQI